MDLLCVTISLVSLGIICVVTIILFVQYYRLKGHVESDMQHIISQVNDVNDLYLNTNAVQDNNIKALDSNLNMLRSQVVADKTNVISKDVQMLVKKNSDGTVVVCQPDGQNCRSL